MNDKDNDSDKSGSTSEKLAETLEKIAKLNIGDSAGMYHLMS